MSLLMPTVMLKSVTDISLGLIRSLGAEAILLDVDNTLARHGSQSPFDGAVEWTHMVREAGIGIVIVSNNLKKRVAPFAAKFDLPYVTHGLKPLPWGFNKARRMLGNDSKNVLVVGDQIYTDILGANLAKMKSILLEPVEHGESLSIWFRRWLEKPVRRKIRRLQNRGEM